MICEWVSNYSGGVDHNGEISQAFSCRNIDLIIAQKLCFARGWEWNRGIEVMEVCGLHEDFNEGVKNM